MKIKDTMDSAATRTGGMLHSSHYYIKQTLRVFQNDGNNKRIRIQIQTHTPK